MFSVWVILAQSLPAQSALVSDSLSTDYSLAGINPIPKRLGIPDTDSSLEYVAIYMLRAYDTSDIAGYMACLSRYCSVLLSVQQTVPDTPDMESTHSTGLPDRVMVEYFAPVQLTSGQHAVHPSVPWFNTDSILNRYFSEWMQDQPQHVVIEQRGEEDFLLTVAHRPVRAIQLTYDVIEQGHRSALTPSFDDRRQNEKQRIDNPGSLKVRASAQPDQRGGQSSGSKESSSQKNDASCSSNSLGKGFLSCNGSGNSGDDQDGDDERRWNRMHKAKLPADALDVDQIMMTDDEPTLRVYYEEIPSEQKNMAGPTRDSEEGAAQVGEELEELLEVVRRLLTPTSVERIEAIILQMARNSDVGVNERLLRDIRSRLNSFSLSELIESRGQGYSIEDIPQPMLLKLIEEQLFPGEPGRLFTFPANGSEAETGEVEALEHSVSRQEGTRATRQPVIDFGHLGATLIDMGITWIHPDVLKTYVNDLPEGLSLEQVIHTLFDQYPEVMAEPTVMSSRAGPSTSFSTIRSVGMSTGVKQTAEPDEASVSLVDEEMEAVMDSVQKDSVEKDSVQKIGEVTSQSESPPRLDSLSARDAHNSLALDQQVPAMPAESGTRLSEDMNWLDEPSPSQGPSTGIAVTGSAWDAEPLSRKASSNVSDADEGSASEVPGNEAEINDDTPSVNALFILPSDPEALTRLLSERLADLEITPEGRLVQAVVDGKHRETDLDELVLAYMVLAQAEHDQTPAENATQASCPQSTTADEESSRIEAMVAEVNERLQKQREVPQIEVTADEILEMIHDDPMNRHTLLTITPDIAFRLVVRTIKSVLGGEVQAIPAASATPSTSQVETSGLDITGNDDEKDRCSICLRDIVSLRGTASLACGHVFCSGCIEQHNQGTETRNKQCPVCRKPFDKITKLRPN